ncbi:MAG: Uma2 family endonuclease [Chloroflexi bacterium]|nr:Uma2 family endonuclease [Chloroflexota bacterium]
MVVALQRRRFTADEFEQMAEAGILGEDERVELLEGEIVAMSPIGTPHAWCVNRLGQIFARLGDAVIVSVQNPVRLDDWFTPQPDLAVLRPDVSQARHPGPADVLLAIEVASSSVGVDREIKAPAYARAGVVELWLVDLVADRLEVHRDPSPIGYRLIRLFGRDEQVSPLFAPDFMVRVDAVLGPPSDTP